MSNNNYPSLLRHHGTFSPITTPVNPGTTPTIHVVNEEEERQAAENGVRIPPRQCIISWDLFKENVSSIISYACTHSVNI
jgi:hypothetical protein